MRKWWKELKFRQVLWDLFLLAMICYYVWSEPRLLWAFPVIAAMRGALIIFEMRAMRKRKWQALSIVQEHFKERYEKWHKEQNDHLVAIDEEGRRRQDAHIKEYASEIKEAWLKHTETDECDEGLCSHCVFSHYPCRDLERRKVCAQKWYDRRKASGVKFEGVTVDWDYLWKLGIDL